MTKLLFAFLLFTSPVMAEEKEAKWPTYCIRSTAANNDGTFSLDMPGYPYGMNDKPMTVASLDRLESVADCAPDDPRML